jgi:hypothetical protein
MGGVSFAFSSAVPFYYIAVTSLDSLLGTESIKFLQTGEGFSLYVLQYMTILFSLMLLSSNPFGSDVLFSNFFFSNIVMRLILSIMIVSDVVKDVVGPELLFTFVSLLIIIFLTVLRDLRNAVHRSDASGWVFLIRNTVTGFSVLTIFVRSGKYCTAVMDGCCKIVERILCLPQKLEE